MNAKLSSVLAVVLTLALVAPPAFFAAAPRAHAIDAEIVSDTSPTGISNAIHLVKTSVESTFSAVKNAVTAISSVTSAAADIALQINKYVLEPIAFVESGLLLKAITAGVLDFINGKTNGLGRPQFITDLRGHLAAVRDVEANAFFLSFGRNSNSPFAASITSSLRARYAEQTSLAGFFAANRNTLPQFSPNVNRFLAGDWSQGGVAAWFALTTQDQNNPYLLHDRAQTELAILSANTVSARLNELAYGKGFLSWCGSTRQVAAPANSGGAIEEVAITPAVSANEVCLKEDGTPGFIQTPGATIAAFLDKTLGATIDKLTGIGSLGPEVNSILGNVATVLNTVNFATNLLGGGGGGLTGVSAAPAGGGQSALSSYANSPSYFGITTQQATQDGTAAVQQYQNQANAAASAAAAAHDAQVNAAPSNGSTLPPAPPTPPTNPTPLP